MKKFDISMIVILLAVIGVLVHLLIQEEQTNKARTREAYVMCRDSPILMQAYIVYTSNNSYITSNKLEMLKTLKQLEEVAKK